MERTRVDIGFFAAGVFGFLIAVAGIITSSIGAVVGGGVLVALALGYFGLTTGE